MTSLAPGTILESVPIFPLPKVTFFPHTLLPLHVFEPRYLAMLEHVMTCDPPLMGVVQLVSGWEDDYYGQPAVHEVVGLGEVMRRDDAPSGRSNILLKGQARVRIIEELNTEADYRVVRALVLGDRWLPGDDAAVERELLAVRQLFLGILTKIPGLDLDTADGLFSSSASPTVVLDAIASALPLSPDRKQELLAAERVITRAQTLTSSLAELSEQEPFRVSPPRGGEGEFTS